jgi:selenium-dependent xanthine dehydrogenase
MINFILNGENEQFSGSPETSLLSYLRNTKRITSVKDGCSGEGTCGACLVSVDGKPRMACTIKMEKMADSHVVTLEGIPAAIKNIIAESFVDKGAVQCGFCTPGFIMRSFILLSQKPDPSVPEIKSAINANLCRCTGYQKIIEAVQLAGQRLSGSSPQFESNQGKVGESLVKYQALTAALGERKYTDDLYFDGMLFSALRFSDHPRAKVLEVNIEKALSTKGVIKVFTARDIPGQRFTGLIYNDWPLMITVGEITRYIGDVIASVVAETEEIARLAAQLVEVKYEVFEPVTDPLEAITPKSPMVHPDHENLLGVCEFKRGNTDEAFENAKCIASGIFQTQRIEHAFLEKESAVAIPDNDGICLYSQGQGIYEDRRQIAQLLNLPVDKVRVILVPNGGGFGGKEDLTVQGHVALQSWLLKKPVKLTLSRPESIRMHPKRHPVWMEMKICCDKNGLLTGLKLNAVGDTGAYASVGTKVMERVAGHATGGYQVNNIEIEAKTVYTNNIPSGAMRGFGVNQVVFALEVLIDELCEKGGFDRWQFRYNNALVDGAKTATGQKVYGVGIRDCLLALKDDFYKAKYAGLATGIKNSGVGNGMVDKSGVRITIKSEKDILIEHGWTEMGQGVHNMAIQTLCTETGWDPKSVNVVVDTHAGIVTGMTTSSRATMLLGLAIINAAKKIKKELDGKKLTDLAGKSFDGEYICDWTTKPGTDVVEPITHFAYGYAAQLCIVNESGEVEKVIAAHDGGKVMNPALFEGQIQGAVHMGLGFALTEDLPMENGFLVSDKLRNCKILRANQTPEIEVMMIERPDPVGPYGAKGIGEIGLVPTAGAVANAYTQFDGLRRYNLPLRIHDTGKTCSLKLPKADH